MNAMHEPSAESNFRDFIREARELARARGVIWDIAVDLEGRVLSEDAWDLRRMRNEPSLTPMKLPPLAHVGPIDTMASDTPGGTALPAAWQDLLKALVVRAIFVDRLSCSYVMALTQGLRILATKAWPLRPWEVNASHAEAAVTRARESQPSGKAADYVRIICQRLFDRHSLSANCPIGIFGKETTRLKAQRFAEASAAIGARLSDRKAAEKLPERRAFWELQRIIWTETPLSFHDFIRFAMLRVVTLTGLRIGECARLPADWKRVQPYYDLDGTPADRVGGIGEAVKLRYFVEKRDASDRPLGALIEESKWIPRDFQSLLDDTLQSVLVATAPLRDMLRRQCESGRILPQYASADLIPALDAVRHFTGTSILWRLPRNKLRPIVAQYRTTYAPADLAALDAYQRSYGVRVSTTVPRYMRILRDGGVRTFTSSGEAWPGVERSYEGFVRVGDMEEHAQNTLATKLSDRTPFVLADGGYLQPWDMLFLHPKRALGDGRNDNPCDTRSYAFVGVVGPDSVESVMGEGSDNDTSLFERYSRNDEDRGLAILTHSLRHLMTTTLFRNALSDAMVSKYFGKRTAESSADYDHRSLGEMLMVLDVPTPLEETIGPNAAFVATLIANNLVSGPIVDQFEHFLATEGEEAALAFLAAEADGFHVTPYGFCIRSFSAAPCPKHLECFNDCLYATATGLPEHTRSLVALKRGMQTQLKAARAHPANTIGRDNQIRHAEVRIAGIRRFLAAKPSTRVFPHGVDRSRLLQRETPLDG